MKYAVFFVLWATTCQVAYARCGRLWAAAAIVVGGIALIAWALCDMAARPDEGRR